MTFECPQCSEIIEADAEMVGTRAPCPHCRKKVTVPKIQVDVRPGSRANEVTIEADAETAEECVAEAIKMLGRVTQREPGRAVQGRVKYGLQSVKVRVSLVERRRGETNVVIQASGDDVWGTAARSATERLVEMLLNLDNAGYRPDRLGVSPGALVGMLILFVILVLLAVNYVMPLVFKW